MITTTFCEKSVMNFYTINSESWTNHRQTNENPTKQRNRIFDLPDSPEKLLLRPPPHVRSISSQRTLGRLPLGESAQTVSFPAGIPGCLNIHCWVNTHRKPTRSQTTAAAAAALPSLLHSSWSCELRTAALRYTTSLGRW